MPYEEPPSHPPTVTVAEQVLKPAAYRWGVEGVLTTHGPSADIDVVSTTVRSTAGDGPLLLRINSSAVPTRTALLVFEDVHADELPIEEEGNRLACLPNGRLCSVSDMGESIIVTLQDPPDPPNVVVLLVEYPALVGDGPSEELVVYDASWVLRTVET